jgi:HEAT repeat protein
LQDSDPKTRLRAVKLAQASVLIMPGQLLPLLHDPAEEVRRAMILAVGGNRRAISDEDLALGLHDTDAEVRQLSEAALRGRGLAAADIQLIRLVTDHRPTVRMEVLFRLRDRNDLDAGLWLRRLSHDPSEAVRLAAVRAAVEQELADLTDRLDEMARTDPSPTVCQWARYYLACQKKREVHASR